VTGAGSGIGRATALKLATEEADVALLGRKHQSLEEVANQIEAAEDRTLVLPADVTDWAAIQGAVGQMLKKWNRLDRVVANAGINGVWAPIDELAPDEWRRTIDVNLTGSFLAIQYAVPAPRRQGGSVVVVANFSNQLLERYELAFPGDGTWRLRMNTDWEGYSPDFDNRPTADLVVKEGKARLPIPSYSVLIYSQDPM